MMFREQAEKCRRQAGEFAGRPEAPFLLRVASAFDDLAMESDSRLIIRGAAQSAPRFNA
jgi:hypothetical protein